MAGRRSINVLLSQSSALRPSILPRIKYTTCALPLCRRYRIRVAERRIEVPLVYSTLPRLRQFHVSAKPQAGLMPDTDDPKTPETRDHDAPTKATEITPEEYSILADTFFDGLINQVEELQENEPHLDFEYSAGVMNIDVPNKGSYVLNKQPPNKQIWLSSPLTGPKRYDWVVSGESMDQKEGSGSGSWIYLRDGSDLAELLRKEIGVNIESDGDAWKSGQSPTVTE